MSKKLTELEAAALSGTITGWTPAHQAALYHIHLAQQAEKDEAEAEKEKKKAERKLREENRPEEVDPAELVDDFIKRWNPPLYNFLDIFAPPHASIGLFVLFHIIYWLVTPWYIHFTISWPTSYVIPIYSTFKAITTGEDRVLWLSYWPILALIAYFELWFFKDGTRALRLWPKLKAVLCVILYSVVDNEKPSSKSKESPKPIYAAVRLIEKIVPAPKLKTSKDKTKDKDKEKSKSKMSSSSSSSKGKDEKAKKK